jgi:hypothetical protein
LALRIARTLGIVVAAVALGAGRAASEDVPAWAWLSSAPAGGDEAKVAPDLPPDLAEVARRALPAVVTLATTAGPSPPTESSAEGGGFLLSRGGVVVTARGVLARVGPGRRLWARTPGTPWTPAVPLGTAAAGDVGVVRLASARRDHPTLRFGPVETASLGKVFVVVGPVVGRRSVASAATLRSITWFDPRRPGGRVETPRGAGRTVDRGARAATLETDAPLWGPGREGSPILDAEGRCVGLVGSEGTTPNRARAADLVSPLASRIAADGTWDPPDLGVRFAPATADPPPPVLVEAREKERSGVLVSDVVLGGPSQAVLWEGDVVLSIAGTAVFQEFPDSLAFATSSLVLDEPAEVAVFRGGKRKALKVAPRRARSLYPDFAREDDARAGLRR